MLNDDCTVTLGTQNHFDSILFKYLNRISHSHIGHFPQPIGNKVSWIPGIACRIIALRIAEKACGQ